MPAYAPGQIVEPAAVGNHQMAKWAFFGKSQFCRPTRRFLGNLHRIEKLLPWHFVPMSS
jgi:hypothetical protein